MQFLLLLFLLGPVDGGQIGILNVRVEGTFSTLRTCQEHAALLEAEIPVDQVKNISIGCLEFKEVRPI